MVKQGNILMYPVASHYGWSESGYDRPTQCKIASASVTGSPANYYCNLMDVMVGLIFYPVPNQNITELQKTSSWAPTLYPTERPTPLPGEPTLKPSTSRPTSTPRPNRSARPTLNPNASLKPTNSPVS
jgi:hypothetical protein